MIELRINRLVISGLRGALKPFELALGGRSWFVVGENGFGKSTISDGIEFWSTGQVRAFHREDCLLDAVIHVDADEAVVTAELEGGEARVPIRRVLRGNKASPLEPEAPAPAEAIPSAPIPLLRHETMREFMDKRPGEKKKELLEILGLSDLSGFRDVLRTTQTRAKQRRDEAERGAIGERRELERLCAGEEPQAVAARLAKEAGLKCSVRSEDDLLALQLDDQLPKAEPDRLARVTAAERAHGELEDAPAQSWNEAVADRATVEQSALAALLEQGERLLSDWEGDECPLCGAGVDADELRVRVSKRAGELARAQGRIRDGKQKLTAAATAWDQLAHAISELESVAPDGGWLQRGQLEVARERASGYRDELTRAAAELAAISQPPALELDGTLSSVRKRAEELAGSSRTKALLELSGLAAQTRRCSAADRRCSIALCGQRAVERMLAIADAQIEAAIEGALSRLAERVGHYYLALQRATVYSDVALSYQRKRSGGIEFSLRFDGRKTISPPQRLVSSSQLNALGLALFLARIKEADQPWGTLVLDDVVNTFDGPHRQGLIRLLDEEFADWQVIILSHDRGFADITQANVTGGWRFIEISQWTPRGGPVLSEGDPRRRLQERLEEGAAATDLGGLARHALERGLAKPVQKLEYKVRYDPHHKHTAAELLHALRGGLKAGRSPLADAPVLARIEGSSYMSTLGVHYRPDVPSPTREDLAQLVEDLAELEQLFTCENCEQPVWSAETRSGYRCGCSALAA